MGSWIRQRSLYYLQCPYGRSLSCNVSVCIWQEEAACEQKAKEEEAANEEFDKWKTAFSVDTEGTVEEDAQEESQGLLFDFVEYIKVITMATGIRLLYESQGTGLENILCISVKGCRSWMSCGYWSQVLDFCYSNNWYLSLQKHKCVALEDLAAEFNLRTQVGAPYSKLLYLFSTMSW